MKRMRWKLCLCMSAALLAAQLPGQAQNAFLLPGESVIGSVSADVTGDGVDDLVQLVGRRLDSSRLVRDLNFAVQDGQSGEILRASLQQIAGYGAGALCSDQNGDGVKDALLAYYTEGEGVRFAAVSFRQNPPLVLLQPPAPPAYSGEVVLTEADHGRTLTVKKGCRVELRLPEQAGTGYVWQLQSFDANALEFLGQQNFVPADTAEMVGKPGLTVFSARAKTPGQTRVALQQYRPWEGESAAINRFAVTLKVVE